MFKITFSVFLCILFSTTIFAQDQKLAKKIQTVIQSKKATVGVAVIYDGKDTLSINNAYYYPTMSVYKFPLALAVLDYIEKNKIPLDTQIFVQKSDLVDFTYSPLRDEKPEGNFHISIRDLIKYSVSKSDNNACDILFDFIGGTEIANQYIKGLGIKDLEITATEKVMHEKMENQYLNWSSPLAMTQLLEIFLNKDLFKSEYKEFLLQTMIGTTTGANKIKALLPKNTIVGHKTGSSFRNSQGLNIADNDAGFVQLPNGKKYSLTIYVMNSMEDQKNNEGIIADISKVVFDHYSKK